MISKLSILQKDYLRPPEYIEFDSHPDHKIKGQLSILPVSAFFEPERIPIEFVPGISIPILLHGSSIFVEREARGEHRTRGGLAGAQRRLVKFDLFLSDPLKPVGVTARSTPLG